MSYEYSNDESQYYISKNRFKGIVFRVIDEKEGKVQLNAIGTIWPLDNYTWDQISDLRILGCTVTDIGLNLFWLLYEDNFNRFTTTIDPKESITAEGYQENFKKLWESV